MEHPTVAERPLVATPGGSRVEVTRYRFFMWALAFFIVVHVVALPALAFLVQPGFDLSRPVAERAAWVSEHTLLWRLGWLPWQLSALSDLLVTGCLIIWLSKVRAGAALRWAWVSAGFAVVAAIPEQLSEAVLVTSHVDLARDAVNDPAQLDAFDREQRTALGWTSVWAASAYIGMTIAWHRALSLAAGTAKWLDGAAGKLLAATVALLGAVTGLVAVQLWADRADTFLISLFGGAGFLVLIAWSFAAADLAGRAAADNPNDPHTVVWPSGTRTRWMAAFANSRGLRDLMRPAPFLPLRSDITDVVYLSWLVPTRDAQRFLPEPLECDDLDGMTVVSVLTYEHGSFGPACAGPLRRALPSPRQSNWRLYVEPAVPEGERDAVYFLRSVLSSTPHVVLSRAIADGLPAHPAKRFEHRRNGRTITSMIDPGGGSSPGLYSVVEEADDSAVATTLPLEWSERFADFATAAEYLIEQNRALSVDEVFGVIRESSIDIPIDVADARPCVVTDLDVSNFPVELRPPEALVGIVAFVIPQVGFRAIGEGVVCGVEDAGAPVVCGV